MFSIYFCFSVIEGAAVEPMELDQRPKKVFKEIDVEYPDLDKKPHFAFPLRDRCIQERDTFKLTCTIDGHPLPEVSPHTYIVKIMEEFDVFDLMFQLELIYVHDYID